MAKIPNPRAKSIRQKNEVLQVHDGDTSALIRAKSPVFIGVFGDLLYPSDVVSTGEKSIAGVPSICGTPARHLSVKNSKHLQSLVVAHTRATTQPTNVQPAT